jgi:hypothetical protein
MEPAPNTFNAFITTRADYPKFKKIMVGGRLKDPAQVLPREFTLFDFSDFDYNADSPLELYDLALTSTLETLDTEGLTITDISVLGSTLPPSAYLQGPICFPVFISITGTRSSTLATEEVAVISLCQSFVPYRTGEREVAEATFTLLEVHPHLHVIEGQPLSHWLHTFIRSNGLDINTPAKALHKLQAQHMFKQGMDVWLMRCWREIHNQHFEFTGPSASKVIPSASPAPRLADIC